MEISKDLHHYLPIKDNNTKRNKIVFEKKLYNMELLHKDNDFTRLARERHEYVIIESEGEVFNELFEEYFNKLLRSELL